MKNFLSIALIVALFAVLTLAAPEGTRQNPAKITDKDATKRHHEILDEDGEEAEPSAAHESKRIKRGILETISDTIHGKSDTKLVAIPISHGVKVGSSKGKKVGGVAGVLGAAGAAISSSLSSISLAHVPLVAKAAKLALPVVKPVIVKTHFAGKVLGHKVHTAGKIISHTSSKLSHFF